MKKIFTVLLLSVVVCACKKAEDSPTYTVKYVVTGTSVNEFKFNDGNSVTKAVKTPFTGTRDTVIIYQKGGLVLNLQAKADAAAMASLSGKIYVNEVEVATQTDADTDKDGKTQIKIEYSLK
ncbi:MAG: hypothetical protein V4714_13335 [Bacteroidota bacterium]